MDDQGNIYNVQEVKSKKINPVDNSEALDKSNMVIENIETKQKRVVPRTLLANLKQIPQEDINEVLSMPRWKRRQYFKMGKLMGVVKQTCYFKKGE